MTPDALRAALATYISGHEPTALWCTARRVGRPVITRRGGRPAATYRGRDGRVLVRDSVLVSGWHLARAAHVDLAAVRGAVAAVDDPRAVRFLRGFSTIDSPGQITERGWMRVRLAYLGLPDVDPDAAGREVTAWEADRTRSYRAAG